MNNENTDFIRRCEEYTESIESYGVESRAYERMTVDGWRCTKCGVESRDGRSCDCQSWRSCGEREAIPSGRADWLVIPSDLYSQFVSAPYAWGESIPAANRRVLEFELEDFEDHWDYIGHFGHTTGGGIIAIDPKCPEVVDFFAGAESALANYPLLDDEAHSEVEREMWGEYIEEWMTTDFIRDLERSDAVRSLFGNYPGEIVGEIVEAVEYVEDTIRAILWGMCGYYSADDPSYDGRAVTALATCFATIIREANWDLEQPTADEIRAFFEEREIQFLFGKHDRVENGYIEPSAARNVTLEMR